MFPGGGVGSPHTRDAPVSIRLFFSVLILRNKKGALREGRGCRWSSPPTPPPATYTMYPMCPAGKVAVCLGRFGSLPSAVTLPTMAGEFDFIQWLRFQQAPSERVALPAGDDLAVLRWDAADLLLVGVDQVLDG